MIIILAIWGIYRILKGTAERRQAERAERERQRIREEQAAQRREIAEMRERARQETRRQIEAEKQRIAWQKEQERKNHGAKAERERLAKEQERQWKELERQAAEQEKMKQQLETARFDIDFLLDRLAKIDTQTDYFLSLQAACVPGSEEYAKYERKIMTLQNQAHAAETKLHKAEYSRQQAERSLAK